uniref:Integrase catalytic domain-containing protein n=1 Tax=Fagus sylvatica TaxID=28930 RepID=A0A2N9IHV4_FAGSY
MDPLKYLFEKPALTGKLSRWLILLAKFDLKYVAKNTIKGMVIAEHCAGHPVGEDDLDDDFPDEDVLNVKEKVTWKMYFDGASNQHGYEVRVLLTEPDGVHIPFANSENMEDEGRASEALSSLPQGVRQKFTIEYTYMPRSQNQFVDALATLASLVQIPMNTFMQPIDIKRREVLAHEREVCVLDNEINDGIPWYYDIRNFVEDKITPKASNGHEFILVAIDYFTKWVEVASFSVLKAKHVARFIESNIIYCYRVPHEIISDNGLHFEDKVQRILQKYGVKHHKSSPYRPQTNGAVESANKNVKVILEKSTERYRD